MTEIQDPSQARLNVEVKTITFRNDENGWTVSKVKDLESGDQHTIVGAFGAIYLGQAFHVYGGWIKHPHYGPQFRVERAVPLKPSTTAGILRYLSSGLIRGIGPKTAEKIVKHFGIKTLEILEKEPHRLREIDKIGRKKMKDILSSITLDRKTNEIMLFLSTYGISPLFATRLLKLYGPEAVDVVSQNPYQLAEDVHGIGFKTADRIALEVGIPKDSLERVVAATKFHLKLAEEQGHCYLTQTQLTQQLSAALEVETEVLEARVWDAIHRLNERGAVMIERCRSTTRSDDTAVFRYQTFSAEESVAAVVQRLLSTPMHVDHDRVKRWLDRYCEAAGTSLSEDQMKAVLESVSSRIFILTGGPGVGKTTTANTIIKLFLAMGKTVALAAPTGRAAQRLSEVSSVGAKTIHRLLEWQAESGTFARTEQDPLTAEVVIVDEASMLDIHLAESLFRALSSRCQLVLIGDVDQLPSVGPGNVLADLIRSDIVPCRRLSKVFRQAESSFIIQNAHSINRGEYPLFNNEFDCRFVDAQSSDEVKNIIRQILSEQQAHQNFHPIRDVQILTPMNRGDLGTNLLNVDLQEFLNPARPGIQETTRGTTKIRDGDKVIQVVNNYDLGVFNGDIGFVENCRVEGGDTIVRFGDRRVRYSAEAALDLRLAYAITIHKSQGSEFPVVILPFTMQHFMMLQRNLVYTGLTRAKKLAIFVGQSKALQMAIRNCKSSERQTRLLSRLGVKTVEYLS